MPHKLTAQGSRPAVAAGSFYPGSAENLRRTVSGLLASAQSGERTDLSGIIVPHAGYVYSGAVAAQAFARIPDAKNRFSRCVIVGVGSHWLRGVREAMWCATTRPKSRSTKRKVFRSTNLPLLTAWISVSLGLGGGPLQIEPGSFGSSG